MQALKSQTALRRGGIVYLRTDELTPNPVQPRKRFDDESLEEAEHKELRHIKPAHRTSALRQI